MIVFPKKARAGAAALAATWCVTANSARASDVEFILPYNTLSQSETEDDPQYRASRAMLQQVMAQSAVAWTARAVPSGRGLEEIDRRADRCGVYVTPKTAASHGLIYRDLVETQFVMLARADSSIHFDRLDDARKYRVGTILKTAMDQILETANVPADLVSLDSQNYRKLMQNRIDLWFTTLDNFRNLVPEGERANFTIAYRGDRVRTGFGCNPAIDPEILAVITDAAASFSNPNSAHFVSVHPTP